MSSTNEARITPMFLVLCIVYTTTLILSNIIACKLIQVAGYILPAAVIVYPIVYIISHHDRGVWDAIVHACHQDEHRDELPDGCGVCCGIGASVPCILGKPARIRCHLWHNVSDRVRLPHRVLCGRLGEQHDDLCDEAVD